ncbi:hypothetical protein TUM20985_26270 [Mycobacterium antarcticum]|uniref:TfoX/Sxy family protein n=1 Tax=unclassified Mycolicibacterium TaxID=2636767 RepID=UPI00239CD5B3|nr:MULTISPECIES: TfoX/Sxy family protein [unclassified Mycolicibacterium]BDX32080.1 hypothetical protein TUM20985_26270 [Mycolicibacterium sp. TUM20985]GLP75384.1 hypothetical protein TUM20983_24940 [Mycolicibacterium sp. TUM20983]GLP84352.1 hypothetical protein TUM20984_57720 [Mycolicibacterium sp. TUM20984]
MAYDEELANRVRELFAAVGGVEEKRMFGGLAFLVGGNMAVCVSGSGGLMVRVPAEQTDALTARDHVEPMIMGGKETRGWIRVTTDGLTTTRRLGAWVDRGTAYASSLPAK